MNQMMKWGAVAMLAFSLAACSEETKESVEEAGDNIVEDSKENVEKVEGQMKNEAGVQGIVKAIDGADVTVEVTETVKGPDMAEGSEIVFHMDEIEADKVTHLKENDKVEIHYNGITTKSLPPQANAEDLIILTRE
ncbi:DUF3221 domain-containing protein [Savagea sp. SN6]|uniref:DUF3221 domain-containing protein n=1 Tax=Savagea serpentis TaxID=2785297 RepID=A0A8J7KBU1_9BACL|nr:DUF3221 domain-containing protein [Savagea serpentis]MBF4500767.1 DUF3221 domain-containing protein [Savagea serpentis]